MNTIDTRITELEAVRSNKSAVNQQIIEVHSNTLTNTTPSHDHYDTDQEEDYLSDADTDMED